MQSKSQGRWLDLCEEINKSIPLPEKLKLIRTSPFANAATQVMLDVRVFMRSCL